MANRYQFAEMKVDDDQIVYINTQYITSFKYDKEYRKTIVDILGEGDFRRVYPGDQTDEILQSFDCINS